MMPKVNLGVGEMGFMFCDLYVSLKKTFARDINSMDLHCLTSIWTSDTSDYQNSSCV